MGESDICIILSALLLLTSCAKEVPRGPASLQVVPPNYYSDTIRYRAYVLPSEKTKRARTPQTIIIEREASVPVPAVPPLQNQQQIIDILDAAQGQVRAARGEMTNKGFAPR